MRRHTLLLIACMALLRLTSQVRDTTRRPITLNLAMATEYEDNRTCSIILLGIGSFFSGYGAYSRQYVPLLFGTALRGSGAFMFTYNRIKFKQFKSKKKRHGSDRQD